MADTNAIKWGARAFLAVGYGALAASLYFLVAHTVFWFRAESTEGTVRGWKYMERERSRTSSDSAVRLYAGSRAKAIVVSFEGPTGEEIIFATDWGSDLVTYDTGETVTVLYDPEDPVASAKIRSFIALYLGPLMLIILGAGFWFFGTLASFFGQQSEPRARSEE